MALGMEIAAIPRTQDYAVLKHNEDAKAQLNQENGLVQTQKAENQANREVHNGQNADWHNNKMDAREKGKNEYTRDGRKRKKSEQQDGRVVVKQHGGFDIKI